MLSSLTDDLGHEVKLRLVVNFNEIPSVFPTLLVGQVVVDQVKWVDVVTVVAVFG